MTTTSRYPEVEGLFTWPSDEPQLIGAKCQGCDSVFFPSFAAYHRPGCVGGPVEEDLLARRGLLISYTIQHYPPPPPYPAQDPFEPFVLGTVALPDGLQIPGQIVNIAPGDVVVGLEVELVVDTLYVDESGNDVVTWKFKVTEPHSSSDGGNESE
jgi:uncharacterized protein